MGLALIFVVTLASFAELTFAAETAPNTQFAFENGANSTGWINVDIVRGSQIFVPVTVNGHRTMAYLINGTPSRIDSRFAESINLNSQASQPNGAASAGTAAVEVQVGKLTMRQTTVQPGDFSQLSRTMGRPTPFWLGNELFNAMAIDIDYAHHRIAISNPAKVRKPMGAQEIPLVMTAGERTVPVSVEGASPSQFALWLGNSGDLIVYQSFYEAHKLLRGRRSSERFAGGIGAFNAEPIATLNGVQFAGVNFRQVPAAFVPDAISKVDSPLVSGGLGAPMLARFHLLIDYAHNRLYATPDPETLGTPLDKDRLGLVIRKEETGLVVTFVSPDSPAKAANFKAGEKVKLINGKPPDAWSYLALTMLRFTPAEVSFDFTMEDGGVRKVKSADFF
jgi:hypothetical protein